MSKHSIRVERARACANHLEYVVKIDYNLATQPDPARMDISMSDEVPTSVRLPREFVKRLDALVPRLEQVPTFAALGPLTRSKVLRLALARGIEVLEAEHGKGRSR